MRFVPLADRVLVLPESAERTTATGIIIPDVAAQEKPQMGEVKAVGPGRTLEDGSIVPMSVDVGDLVIFSEYAGTTIKVGGVEYLSLREADIQLYYRPEGTPDEDGQGD